MNCWVLACASMALMLVFSRSMPLAVLSWVSWLVICAGSCAFIGSWFWICASSIFMK